MRQVSACSRPAVHRSSCASSQPRPPCSSYERGSGLWLVPRELRCHAQAERDMLPVSSCPVWLDDVFLVHGALLCPARLPLCHQPCWGHFVPLPLPCATLLPTTRQATSKELLANGQSLIPVPVLSLEKSKPPGLGSCWHCRCGAPGGSSLPAQSRWGRHGGQSPKAPCRAWGGCAALWARRSARLVCIRQNAAPADTPALCAPGRFLWARHSLCQATTFPAADTHAPVPHSGTHARAGPSYLGHPGPGAAPKRPIARAGDTHTQAWHGTSTLI